LNDRQAALATHWPQPERQKPLGKAGKAEKSLPRGLFWQAMEQGARPMQAAKLHLTLTFYPPTRRAYDLDNALARIKAGLDGLADVLKVDDKHWTLTIRKGETVGGFVEVEITH